MEKCTPQGGNLSLLLANVMPNGLDKELKNHGMHIEWFADDFMIAVGSEASAKRVMYSVTG